MPHNPPQNSGLYTPGGSKDAGKGIGLFGAGQNQETTWLKRSTASAPITPAAKQMASRWLSVVECELSSVGLVSPFVAVRLLSIPCNRLTGWLPVWAKVLFINESPFVLFRSDQVNCDFDVAARGFGVRARLVRGLQDRLRDLTLQTREARIETSPEKVPIGPAAKVHFRIERDVSGEPHFHSGSDVLHRADEASSDTVVVFMVISFGLVFDTKVLRCAVT